MRRNLKTLLFAAIPLALVAAVFLGGFYLGKYKERRHIYKSQHRWNLPDAVADHVRRAAQSRTLGGVFRLHRYDDERLRGAASAYRDPAWALAHFDGIAYCGRETPTPFLGYAPQPGEFAGMRVNSRQMRAGREVETPKPPGSLRVFITGGSTALGAGAPDNARTAGGYLEAALAPWAKEHGREVEVFTMAGCGWASTHERIAIENIIARLEPDVVVSLTGANDAHFAHYKNDVLNYRSYAGEIYFEVLSMAMRLLGDPIENAVPQAEVSPRQAAAVFAGNMRIASGVLARAGVPHLVFLQPVLTNVDKPLTPREEAEKAKHEALHAFIQETMPQIRRAAEKAVDEGAAFKLFDLNQGTFAGVEEEVFLDNYHFGDRGYGLIGRKVAEVVRKEIGKGF